MENNIINISLWGETVGKAYWDNKIRRAVFFYSPEWIRKGIEIAPLSASIKSPRVLSGLPVIGDEDKLFSGLPPFLADSLPDAWGNKLFRQWAAAKGISLKRLTSIDRLAYIGSRGMGALEFEPALSADRIETDISLDSLYKAARHVLAERKEITLSAEQVSLRELFHVGTSTGGRRAKALIAINESTGEIRSGQLQWPSEFRHYILKFDEGSPILSPEIENVYYRMAKEAGIDIMPSKIVEIDGQKHFLTERFDRCGGKKIHRLSLAAISPLSDSYEDLLETARRLKVPYPDLEQLFRRTVFNILSGNIDDHNKNFSFIMDSDGNWRVSPAYDLTFTTDPSAPGYVNRHSLTLNGKDTDFTLSDLRKFAANNDISNPDRIISEIRESVSTFSEKALETDIPESIRLTIRSVLDNIALGLKQK